MSFNYSRNIPGFFSLLLFWLMIASPVWSDSSQVLGANGNLDVEKIRTLYFDGDFDRLKTDLEDYRKSHSDASVQDKIIWNKYLGIVYASKPETEKKGEAYLYQWVSLDPNPSIADLFVSQKIRDIYEQQKRDYEAVQKSGNAVPSPEESSNTSTPPSIAKSSTGTEKPGASSESGNSRSWLWWTAGAGAAAVAATSFLLLSGGGEDPGSSESAEVTISWPVPQ